MLVEFLRRNNVLSPHRPMSHDSPFLRAIEDSPHDDGPRLVYADWLEENNDPRAQFIREQCAMTRALPHSESWHQLRMQCHDSLPAYLASWKGLSNDDVPRASPQLHRGFPVRVAATNQDEWHDLVEQFPLCSIVLRSRDFEQHTDSRAGTGAGFQGAWHVSSSATPSLLALRLPNLQSLTIRAGVDHAGFASRFAESELPQQLRTLAIQSRVTNPTQPVSIEFPNLRSLTLLNTVAAGRDFAISAPQLEVLTVAGNEPQRQLSMLPLENLDSLSVRSGEPEMLDSLVKLGAFQLLRRLNLAGIDLNLVKQTFDNQCWDSLERLGLWMQPELQQNILGSQLLEKLPEGQLRHARGRHWGPHELSALLTKKHPLESVVMTHSNFEVGPIALPLPWEHLSPTLRRLEFRNCYLGQRLVESLRQCCLQEVTTLTVDGSDLNGLQELLGSDAFPNLRCLELPNLRRGPQLGDVIKAMLDSNYPMLLELNLDDTPITPKLARLILQSPRFPRLQRLVHRQFSDQDCTELGGEFGARFSGDISDALMIERQDLDQAII